MNRNPSSANPDHSQSHPSAQTTAAKYAAALLHEERLSHATPLTKADSERLVQAATKLCMAAIEGQVCVVVDNPEQLQRFEIIGSAADWTPLVLDGSRLYMRRYWQYEKDLAEDLLQRAQQTSHRVDLELLSEGLNALFKSSAQGLDWQRLAAAVAALKQFTVISGGPGTGKTTTLVKILALLLAQHQQQNRQLAEANPYRIALAAPTGKAAARMQEALAKQLEQLDLAPEIKEQIPKAASTLHRLLGVKPNSVYFKHNANNQLPVDLLVVDEASMVDLALMSKLLAALPESAKLILLGDRDQLAAVEAGNVLGDICSLHNGSYSNEFGQTLQRLCPDFDYQTQERTNIGESIVVLKHSYRFGANSGIGQVAKAINHGQASSAIAALQSADFTDTELLSMSSGPGAPRQQALAKHIKPSLTRAWRAVMSATSAEQALAALEQWRLLAAVRQGFYGVENLNAVCEQLLQDAGLIERLAGRLLESNLYKGRPIMITRNDPATGLANGDVGVIWEDADGGDLKAYFQQQNAEGELVVVGISPARLPEHETVFAMTVHKSQGSEFDNVVLLLPEAAANVSRELLYTGVTRARKSLSVIASNAALESAIATKAQHESGLVSRLENG